MAGIDNASRGVKRELPAEQIQDLDSVSLDIIPPYDASKEATTRSVTAAKEWRTFIELRNELFRMLMSPLTTATYTDAYTRDLVVLLEKVFSRQELEAIMVSVSGNMGGGKSALLNSLFQVKSGDIARSNGMGSSCTLASNIFKAPERSQKEPFLAEIHFFSVSERREILESYLGDYYRTGHSEDQDGPSTQADKEIMNDIRHEVITTFLALFANEEECESEDKVRAFLGAAQSENDPRILDQLYRWADALIMTRTKGKPTMAVTSSTASMLLTELEQFTIVTEDEHGHVVFSLAPLVEVIYFHFDDPLLRMGISFLDTPGLQDSNRTRRRSAQKFRHKRTHGLIVTGSDRAKSDDNVAKEARAMNSHKSSRIVVVATKSDVIDAATIAPGRASDKTQIERLQKEIKTLRLKSSTLDQEMTSIMSSGDITKMGGIFVKKSKLEVQVRAVENREKALRISMRADNIKSKLQSVVRDSTGKAAPVCFYSVSNWEYQRHLQGYHPKDAPTLTVDETNIPALRELISTFPNEARLSELQHEQKSVFPSLLMRLKIYTSRSAIDRKADMVHYVEAPIRQYEYNVDRAFEELWNQVRRLLLTPMANSEAAWSMKARKLGEGWTKKFSNPQFSALLKTYGHRRARGRTAEVNLSAELISVNGHDLNDWLLRLVQPFNALASDLEGTVGMMPANMLEEMQGDDTAPFVKADPFYEYVQQQAPSIINEIRTAAERCRDDLDVIIHKVIDAKEDAYLVEAMKPIYEMIGAIKHQKGKPRPREGWPSHRKNLLTTEISNLKGVYAQVCQCITRDLEKLLSEVKAELKLKLMEIFDRIRTGFEMRCDATETNDPEEAALRDQLSQAIKKSEEHLHGPMQRIVDTLVRDFR